MNRKIGIFFLMAILLAPVMTASADTGLYYQDANDQYEGNWFDESVNPVIHLKDYEFDKGSTVEIFVIKTSGSLIFWTPKIYLSRDLDYIHVTMGGKRFPEGPTTYFVIVRINSDSGSVVDTYTVSL